jgi:hypothetical protein
MLSRTRAHEWLVAVASLALFLEVPPIVYGYLSYKQFEYLKVTGYIPHEELMIALRSGSLTKILGAPLVSLNMTSGHLFSNIYAFTVGPLIASLILGTVTGVIIVAQLRIQSKGGATSAGSVWGTLCLGLLATVGASSAGLLGCHGGSGMSGGILAISGLSGDTAAVLASLSPYIQAALIVLLSGYCVYLRRKLRQGSVQSAA